MEGITSAVDVATGGSTCALLSNGEVRCWGIGHNGQLGNGAYENTTTPVAVRNVSSAVDIAVMLETACAVSGDGSVYCWGGGNHGQLGNGSTSSHHAVPVRVERITTAREGTGGTGHACVHLENGSLWCWGAGPEGVFGGQSEGSSTPVEIDGIAPAISVSAGAHHTCAVVENNQVWCWGRNGKGQLGSGVTTEKPRMKRVQF